MCNFLGGPVPRYYPVAFVRVLLDPVFPTKSCHPQAVDENDAYASGHVI